MMSEIIKFQSKGIKMIRLNGKISCYSNAFYSAYGDTKPKWWTYSGSHFEEKFENEQNQADNECLSKAASLAIMHPKLEIKKAVRQP